MNGKKTTTSFLIWNVPQEVKTAFKQKCARAGVSMRQAILDFMSTFKQPTKR